MKGIIVFFKTFTVLYLCLVLWMVSPDVGDVAMRSASAEIDTKSVFRCDVDRLYLKSLGEFKLTFYCPCEKCCGKSDGITSTGTKAEANHTVAVDSEVIQYGTVLYIDGQRYVAEDCGGAVKENRIDVFCDTHEEALERGTYFTEVFAEVKE